MKTLIYLLCVCLVSSMSYANDLAYKKKLQLITRALSSAELREVSKKTQIYEEFKEECQLELKAQVVPVSCFKQIELEKSLRMISSKQYKDSKQLLAQLCDLRATTSLKNLPDSKALLDLDPKLECTKRLKELSRQQEYKALEHSPESLFEKVHKGNWFDI